MKPYFQNADVTIYHADCREALPLIDEDSVSLVITDPPYGISFQSGWVDSEAIVGDESQEIARIGLEMMLKPLKYSRHLYVFGKIDLAGLPLTKPVELIWDKDNIGMGNLEIPWGSQHEYIQFYVSMKRSRNHPSAGNLAARLRRGTVLKVPRVNAAALSHPSEKPVALLRELIESSSRIGETVLDAFAGSGSTLAAAQAEGRKSIGIEVEERHCETAAKRFTQAFLNFGAVAGESGRAPVESLSENEADR